MATHTLVVEFDGDGPTYAAGNTRIVISSDGFTGHKLQQAIAQAYDELRVADENEQVEADAVFEVENYGGSE